MGTGAIQYWRVTTSALRDVRSVLLTREILTQTLSELQRFGRDGCEGFLLWLGSVEGPRARVTTVLCPPQDSLKSEDGVGYFVNGKTLLAVSRYLAESRLRLIAQVHSHPSEAYHSAADDRYAVATASGSYSLVVPDFGFAPVDPAQWAVYRLDRTSWNEMAVEDVREAFKVV